MNARVALKRVIVALCYVAAASCSRTAEDARAPAEAATAAVATTTAPPPAASTPPPTAADVAASVAAGSASVRPNRRRTSIDQPAAEIAISLPPPVPTADLPQAASERPSFEPAASAVLEAELGTASAVSSPVATETLDVTALLTRLRRTKAINLRTKLAVKNESEHLMERFRAYHARHGTATLGELRGSYDSLFRRLYSLLEDDDPPLAREIDRSRAAIWAILADPVQFRLAVRSAATRRGPSA